MMREGMTRMQGAEYLSLGTELHETISASMATDGTAKGCGPGRFSPALELRDAARM